MPLNPTKPNHIYLIYMYKEDLALNNLQWLICHKMPIHFYANSQLYFKQFSLAWVHSLIVKTVLIQLIQFSISADFVYTQLNVKTVLC